MLCPFNELLHMFVISEVKVGLTHIAAHVRCTWGAGAGFLLWELSTPFVHLRWLLHKSGRERARLYVVNGLVMMVVFFLCRPVWGTWLSYKVSSRPDANVVKRM